MKLIYFNFYHIRLSQVPGYATLTRPPSGTGLFATPSLTFLQCLSYATTFIVALRFERQHAPSVRPYAWFPSSSFPYWIPTRSAHRYTQVSTEHRHSGRDDGPVRARGESSHRDVKDRRHPESNMRGSKITVHGARYLHPCR